MSQKIGAIHNPYHNLNMLYGPKTISKGRVLLKADVIRTGAALGSDTKPPRPPHASFGPCQRSAANRSSTGVERI